MPPSDATTIVAARIRKRAWFALFGGSAAALILIIASMLLLPTLIVDVEGLNAARAQETLNASRIPLGVAVAGLLAATSAAAGVMVSANNATIARTSLLAEHSRYSGEVARQGRQANDDRFQRCVEMLSADSVAVRTGAIHALAALAKEDGRWQHAIIDVLCAYLRQPFPHPYWDSHEGLSTGRGQHTNIASTVMGEEGGSGAKAAERDREHGVRQSVTRVLLEVLHVRAENTPDGFTPLSLDGAVLDDFDLSHLSVRISMRQTTFTGLARFVGTNFDQISVFEGVTFAGDAIFAHAIFDGPVHFDSMTTRGRVDFERCSFSSSIEFTNSNFRSEVAFNSARAAGPAYVTTSHFSGQVVARHARFASSLWLNDVSFDRDVIAVSMHVEGDFVTSGVTCRAYVDLGSTYFGDYADLRQLKGGPGRHAIDGITAAKPRKVLLPE